MNRIFILISCVSLLSGCLNFNFGTTTDSNSSDNTHKIMLANPLNVYKTSTNIVIKAKSQNTKGRWVDLNTDILIPGGWYIVSGIGIE